MAVFPGVWLYARFGFSPTGMVFADDAGGPRTVRPPPSFCGGHASEEVMARRIMVVTRCRTKNAGICRIFRNSRAFAHGPAPTKPAAMAPNNIRMPAAGAAEGC